jgi:hypothetical protein
MASVRESCINDRISMTRQGYSVLKEKIKDDECGWPVSMGGSHALNRVPHRQIR